VGCKIDICQLGIYNFYYKQWLKFNPQRATLVKARSEASIPRVHQATNRARTILNHTSRKVARDKYAMFFVAVRRLSELYFAKRQIVNPIWQNIDEPFNVH
jgi:hypothetical protein